MDPETQYLSREMPISPQRHAEALDALRAEQDSVATNSMLPAKSPSGTPPAKDDTEEGNRLWPAITNPRQRAFLTIFGMCGGVYRSAKMAGITVRSHYQWLKNSPNYREAYAEAIEMAGDYLEDAAMKRAIDGVEKPVFYQGEICGYTTEYSDSLAKFLLRGLKPARYVERFDVNMQGRSLNIIIDGEDATKLMAGGNPATQQAIINLRLDRLDHGDGEYEDDDVGVEELEEDD